MNKKLKQRTRLIIDYSADKAAAAAAAVVVVVVVAVSVFVK
jgi:hypothetical protein